MNKQKEHKQGSENQPATPQSPLSSLKIRHVFVSRTAIEGPLHSSQAIQKYEEIVPGAANRILEMV